MVNRRANELHKLALRMRYPIVERLWSIYMKFLSALDERVEFPGAFSHTNRSFWSQIWVTLILQQWLWRWTNIFWSNNNHFVQKQWSRWKWAWKWVWEMYFFLLKEQCSWLQYFLVLFSMSKIFHVVVLEQLACSFIPVWTLENWQFLKF